MAEEHIQQLIAAKKRLIEERRGLAAEIAKPSEGETTEKLRQQFIDVQNAIAAVNDAIKDERETHGRR